MYSVEVMITFFYIICIACIDLFLLLRIARYIITSWTPERENLEDAAHQSACVFSWQFDMRQYYIVAMSVWCSVLSWLGPLFIVFGLVLVACTVYWL